MKILKTAALLTGLIIGMAMSASAASTVVLSNDFTDGTTNGWAKSGTVTTLVVQDDTAGIGSGNAMKYATTQKNNQWAERSLSQTVTLDVNDYVSLAMDIRFTGTSNSPPVTNNSIRWMFMTTNDVMTGVGINPGAVVAQGSWFQVGTVMQQSKFASTNLGTTAHHVVLTLTRKDDGAGSYMQFSYALDGGTAFVKNGAVIASPTSEFSFDAIQLGSTTLDGGFDGILYDNITVTLTDTDPAYTLTVISGTGGGSYTNGAQVTITASNIPGKAFAQWTGDTQYVASVTSSPTTVTMSTNPVSLTATYVDAYYRLNVFYGDGDGDYTNGTRVAITANAPPAGETFIQWTGAGTQYVDSVTASNTILTMPTRNVNITATFTSTSAVSYLITGSAGTNGTVSPTSTNVPAGGSADFTVTANPYYRILTLTTNGASVGTFDNGSTSTNFTWNNVQSTGSVVATFTAQVASDPANTPYAWLAGYGLTNFDADAVADQDSDGLKAWQEYIAGTDPTNTASCLKVAQATRNTVTWSAQPDRIYSVDWSTNLVQGFTNLDNNIAYPQSSYTNTNPDAKVNHYRIKVRMQ